MWNYSMPTVGTGSIQGRYSDFEAVDFTSSPTNPILFLPSVYIPRPPCSVTETHTLISRAIKEKRTKTFRTREVRLVHRKNY